MNAAADGDHLRPLAEQFEDLGWQIVIAQWHRPRNGEAGKMTPIRGVTGHVPFLSAATACPPGMRLHREGGPETAPPALLGKPALRPPLDVVGFDIDDGYAGKAGGDTLVEAEMALGTLPGTYSLTARGRYSPSRRKWFRVPPGLIVPDSFFTEFGGFIETIRTGHRFSWADPAIHTRHGKVVGPVLWYDPDSQPCSMPSTTELAELPARWRTAIRDHVAAKAAARPERHVDPATGGEQITAAHADATVAKATRALHQLHPSGGEFRNALFGLAAVVSRRAAALGQSGDTATADTLTLLTEHPAELTPNADDERWISEGVARGYASPWRIVAPCRGVSPTAPAAPTTSVHPATAEELDRFLARCTRYRAPGRLGQRTAWMHADGASELPRHTLALIDEAARGLYPAARALRALRHTFGQPPGTDPAGADLAFVRALGAFLDHKGAAA